VAALSLAVSLTSVQRSHIAENYIDQISQLPILDLRKIRDFMEQEAYEIQAPYFLLAQGLSLLQAKRVHAFILCGCFSSVMSSSHLTVTKMVQLTWNLLKPLTPFPTAFS